MTRLIKTAAAVLIMAYAEICREWSRIAGTPRRFRDADYSAREKLAERLIDS
jgi:hypothetical protein